MFHAIAFIATVVMALVAAGIAQSKNRSALGWGVAGFFFPIIGVVVIAALPAATKKAECPRCHSHLVNTLNDASTCEQCGHVWLGEELKV